MSQDEVIILLFKIVLLANIAAILAFTGIYTRFAPWWKNIIGRSIVILDLLLGAALIPSVISLFWNLNRADSHIIAWVDLGIFTLIALTMATRCITWIRIHKEEKFPEENTEESS